MSIAQGYKLLDSGNGKKLEQFGSVVLARPSSLAIWQSRLDAQIWRNCDAEFVPTKGWSYRAKAFESVETKLELASERSIKFLLHLQSNGQVGMFPEHTQYFSQIETQLKNCKGTQPRVLNLFAYTGLASLWCSSLGAQVTHIDISKKVIDWARQNKELNLECKGEVRFVVEDAIKYLEREARRGSSYDLVIADPPSFSRVSNKQSWDLLDILPRLVELIVAVMNEKKSALFLTSHLSEGGAVSLKNILLDSKLGAREQIEVVHLAIAEHNTKRQLPAGQLVWVGA